MISSDNNSHPRGRRFQNAPEI